MLEIERKFLFSGTVPEEILMGADSALLIIQWYESRDHHRRFRLSVSTGSLSFVETVKSGAGLVREETERTLDQEKFQELKKKLKQLPAVVKVRYVFKRGELEGVIDEYFVPKIGHVLEIETSRVELDIPDPWDFWKLEKKEFEEVTYNNSLTASCLAVKLKIFDSLPKNIFCVSADQVLNFTKLVKSIYA